MVCSAIPFSIASLIAITAACTRIRSINQDFRKQLKHSNHSLTPVFFFFWKEKADNMLLTTEIQIPSLMVGNDYLTGIHLAFVARQCNNSIKYRSSSKSIQEQCVYMTMRLTAACPTLSSSSPFSQLPHVSSVPSAQSQDRHSHCHGHFQSTRLEIFCITQSSYSLSIYTMF